MCGWGSVSSPPRAFPFAAVVTSPSITLCDFSSLKFPFLFFPLCWCGCWSHLCYARLHHSHLMQTLAFVLGTDFSTLSKEDYPQQGRRYWKLELWDGKDINPFIEKISLLHGFSVIAWREIKEIQTRNIKHLPCHYYLPARRCSPPLAFECVFFQKIFYGDIYVHTHTNKYI